MQLQAQQRHPQPVRDLNNPVHQILKTKFGLSDRWRQAVSDAREPASTGRSARPAAERFW